MYRLRYIGDGGKLVDRECDTLVFEEFINNPVLVGWTHHKESLLVYIDGDTNWNILAVMEDFDIVAFTNAEESDAMISGPGYVGMKTDCGKTVMDIIRLMAAMFDEVETSSAI